MTWQEIENEQRYMEQQVSPGTTRRRLDCIDFVRGAVMIVMALDHIRGPMGPHIDPTDLSKTTPMLFFTRWLTHFCAPTFVFLAGTGAYLSGTRGKSKGQISRDFFLRGLWLILLEFTLVKWGWGLNIDHPFELGGGVIWAIGACMVIMSVLVWLPTLIVGGLGLATICFHNAFDAVTPEKFGNGAWVWNMLHTGGTFFEKKDFLTIGETHFDFRIGAGYPLIPWIGVMAAGYAFGALMVSDGIRHRRKFLAELGCLMIGLFLFLRLTNVYGDRQIWYFQPTWQMNVAAVLNCHKYPPSLSYLLMTLGPIMIIMAIVDRPLGWFGRFVVVYGRVPLFYYLLHLPLINAFTRLTADRTDATTSAVIPGVRTQFENYVLAHVPSNWGWDRNCADLLFAYCVWICVVLILFPLCYLWANVKKNNKSWWVSYL